MNPIAPHFMPTICPTRLDILSAYLGVYQMQMAHKTLREYHHINKMCIVLSC